MNILTFAGKVALVVVMGAWAAVSGLNACAVFADPKGPVLCSSWCTQCVGGVCESISDNGENQHTMSRRGVDAGADASH